MEEEKEIDSKEVSDALHMLLHCSLKDTKYETQKEQFKIVNDYIKQLEEENRDLKEDNYAYHQLMRMQNEREYRSKFLKDFQKEYGENVMPDYDEIYKRYDKQKKQLKNSIPKSKVKEKLEELQKQLKYIACGNDDCDKCFNSYRGSGFIYCFAYHQIKVLQELLREE